MAPPGQSLHRYGTELNLGPPAAYGWLAANAGRFSFVKRYACERWLSQRMESESGAHRRHWLSLLAQNGRWAGALRRRSRVLARIGTAAGDAGLQR